MISSFLELLIVAAVLFLVLGSRRIGNILRSLGRGAKNFANEFDQSRDRKLPGGGDEDEESREK